MAEKQDWVQAYLQLNEIIKAEVPEIKYMDLYSQQPQMQDEDGNTPFDSPALFYEFNFNEVETLGKG